MNNIETEDIYSGPEENFEYNIMNSLKGELIRFLFFVSIE